MMKKWLMMLALTGPLAALPFGATGNAANVLVHSPWHLDTGLQSRSISFENPTGERAGGGRVASPLGVGRKGDPARIIQPGETVELANISGAGTIRHIWMTTHGRAEIMRGTVIRAWWDGQKHPSIEAPVGDFFGFAHGKTEPFQTAIHSVGERYGLNIWLPMPFTKSARITITNEGSQAMPLFYQIDYTIGDRHDDTIGRLHVLFQRQNPTTLTRDFEILPRREGRGRYIGTVIGVRPHDPAWWGEGEAKIYLDGDREFPTIAGTGAEDYVGQSWGIQQVPHMYQGASLVTKPKSSDSGPISMYRWHMTDPVYWYEDIRVTMQQIGHKGAAKTLAEYKSQLFERQDDWSAATFWYEPVPSAPLPPMPDVKARLADLDLSDDGSQTPIAEDGVTAEPEKP